jgi:hypothetical protein
MTHRRIKNDRLAVAGYVWAFIAIINHPAHQGSLRQSP